MNAFKSSSPPSPPPSPARSSPRQYRHVRSKLSRFPTAQKLAWFFLTILLRRQGIFLFAPLVYISCMLLYMGSVAFDIVPIISHRHAPGSVYRSPELYAKLRPEIDHDDDSSSADAICNAVAVAGYLNATLVIPNFRYHSVWKDPSKFKDIFDQEYFINILKNDVWVVESVPEYLMERFGGDVANVYNFRIKAWASISYYRDVDMVAFSCCIFDGGEHEKEEMIAARERGWRGKFTRPGRVIRPGSIRINGKCPLTPLEVGFMLRGMGFAKNTSIYLASGKIHNAEKTMPPLLEMFPNLHTKESLASEKELAPFKRYSSRMAAIDYTVCLHSEVFVTTQGGNFPHFLFGHRRYLNGGHSKTIKPDKRKLALLFDDLNVGWEPLKFELLSMRSHNDFKGVELRKPSESLYSFPCPDCMCRINRTDDSRSSAK
ncbi:hypothetical protein PIB30_004504 [Stylosanthes scabra]|uniref:O-fucosyltransferase family protein n=1 Tax=Stylosanthes scabra TaxID=79078 RepID=A0ABU6X5N4_9FABA|nr:hypothetical protein [Stylosanthes scabra]